MKPSTKLRVIRIDPHRQSIASITIAAGKNPEQVLREVKRVLRATVVGHQVIVPAHNEFRPVVIAGALSVDEATPAFRLRGCEEHAGIGILFSQGEGGGMTDVQVSTKWVQQRIVWLAGESAEAMRARAISTVPMLDPALRTAMLAATDRGPLVAGDSVMWLRDEDEQFAAAMTQLGLGDEPTRGQRFSRFGDAVLDILQGAK